MSYQIISESLGVESVGKCKASVGHMTSQLQVVRSVSSCGLSTPQPTVEPGNLREDGCEMSAAVDFCLFCLFVCYLFVWTGWLLGGLAVLTDWMVGWWVDASVLCCLGCRRVPLG